MELHVQVPVSRWIMFNNTIQGHTKYVLQHSLVSHQNGWRPHDWWPNERTEQRRERREELRWNMRCEKTTQRLNVARGFFPLSLFEIDQNYARHICRLSGRANASWNMKHLQNLTQSKCNTHAKLFEYFEIVEMQPSLRIIYVYLLKKSAQWQRRIAIGASSPQFVWFIPAQWRTESAESKRKTEAIG